MEIGSELSFKVYKAAEIVLKICNISNTHFAGLQAIISIYLYIGIGTFVAFLELVAVSIIGSRVRFKIIGIRTHYAIR